MSASENRLNRAVEIQKALTEGITVRFGAHINPDGELIYVTVVKTGVEIHLSPAQAKSLASEILSRIA